MINIIKGVLFGYTDQYTETSTLRTVSFSYRGDHIQLHNWEPNDSCPYIGCDLSKNDVILLRDWLNKAIASSESCDECYNYVLPKNLEINGTIKCKNCGNKTR